MLSGVQERLGPLKAWLFPQRVYLELQDQAITGMVLSGRRLTWLEQLPLSPGLCSAGRPLNSSALADLLGDWLVECGYGSARIRAVLPGAASELRLLKGSGLERIAMPKELEALRLPWPSETAVDVMRSSLPSSPGSSVAVAVEAALLEDWIDVFADAGLALDALEAASVCALRSAVRQSGWLLGLEPEQSWLLRMEQGAPLWQWGLPPVVELEALQNELSQCLRYWDTQAPRPRSIDVVASAAVPASAQEALRGSMTEDLEWMDPFRNAELEDGLSEPREWSLGLLWGLAAAELQR